MPKSTYKTFKLASTEPNTTDRIRQEIFLQRIFQSTELVELGYILDNFFLHFLSILTKLIKHNTNTKSLRIVLTNLSFANCNQEHLQPLLNSFIKAINQNAVLESVILMFKDNWNPTIRIDNFPFDIFSQSPKIFFHSHFLKDVLFSAVSNENAHKIFQLFAQNRIRDDRQILEEVPWFVCFFRETSSQRYADYAKLIKANSNIKAVYFIDLPHRSNPGSFKALVELFKARPDLQLKVSGLTNNYLLEEFVSQQPIVLKLPGGNNKAYRFDSRSLCNLLEKKQIIFEEQEIALTNNLLANETQAILRALATGCVIKKFHIILAAENDTFIDLNTHGFEDAAIEAIASRGVKVFSIRRALFQEKYQAESPITQIFHAINFALILHNNLHLLSMRIDCLPPNKAIELFDAIKTNTTLRELQASIYVVDLAKIAAAFLKLVSENTSLWKLLISFNCQFAVTKEMQNALQNQIKKSLNFDKNLEDIFLLVDITNPNEITVTLHFYKRQLTHNESLQNWQRAVLALAFLRANRGNPFRDLILRADFMSKELKSENPTLMQLLDEKDEIAEKLEEEIPQNNKVASQKRVTDLLLKLGRFAGSGYARNIVNETAETNHERGRGLKTF